jgi:hypothetical protein
MRVDPTVVVEGLTGPHLVKLFRNRHHVTVGNIAKLIGERNAPAALKALIREGYLDADPDADDRYTVAPPGRRFGKAKLTKPVPRASADRAVAEFRARCVEVKHSADYIWKVERAVVFGSYLTDVAHVGDVDIAVGLSRKIVDDDDHQLASEKQVADAVLAGRTFRSFLHELAYAENKVRLFLKARSSILDMTDLTDPVLKQTPSRILYEDIEGASDPTAGHR